MRPSGRTALGVGAGGDLHYIERYSKRNVCCAERGLC